MSGSFLQQLYMNNFQKVNIVVTIIFVLWKLLKRGDTIRYVPRKLTSFFLMAGIVGVFVNMVVWIDFGSFWGYIANASLIIMPFLLLSEVKFELFSECFIKIMVFIAAISIVFFYIPFIPRILPSIRFTNKTVYGGYQWFLIYAKYINSNNAMFARNIGVFWEPGIYQGYLIFTMVLICLRKITKKDIVRIIVLIAAVLSTASTTGYILLLAMVLVFINRILSNQKPALRYAVVLIGCVAILILFNFSGNDFLLSLLPSDVSTKLMDTGNASRNTRLYNIFSDARLAIQNPFGIANSQIDTARISSMHQFSNDVDSSVTNTSMSMLLTYGMIPGILYFALNVKSCFSISKDKLFCLIVFMIMIIIVNTEPHYLCLFFTFIFYMWETKKITPCETIEDS